MSEAIDAARLTLLLNDLRLPAIKQDWPNLAARADKESWPAARFLATLAEHEIGERDRRRLARHLVEAQLLPGKTLDSFDFNTVPMVSKAHVLAICAGDSWIDKGANILLIGGFCQVWRQRNEFWNLLARVGLRSAHHDYTVLGFVRILLLPAIMARALTEPRSSSTVPLETPIQWIRAWLTARPHANTVSHTKFCVRLVSGT